MQPTKILIIEDELIIARTIGRALNRMGYQVTALAASEEEAREALPEHVPDLVLSDIHLGARGDGIRLADWIRNTYHIPVVFLTAFSDLSTLDRAKEVEPYGYIVKPFDDKDLRTGIELALHKHCKDQERSRQETQLRQALTSLDEAILTVTPDFTLELMNRAASQLTGIKLKNGESVRLPEVIIFYSAERQKINWKEKLAGSEGIRAEELICFFPESGLEQRLYVKVCRITLEAGQTAGWTFILSVTPPVEPPATVSGKEIIPAEAGAFRYFFVKKGKKYDKVQLDEVLWIEALDNYILIHTLKDKYITYSSLKEVEQKLPVSTFLKVHRSYIVNLEKIDGLEEDYLSVCGKTIPVSRSCKEQLRQRITLL